MSARRVLINPLFLHRRTRLLWLWYVLTAAAASAILWWRLDAVAAAAGGLPTSLFMRPWFRAAVVVAAGLAATALTAASVAGPVGRIEDWLRARRAGARTRPLRVRSGDAFETLIRLLNEMHVKTTGAAAPATPRRRRASSKVLTDKTAAAPTPARRKRTPRPPSADVPPPPAFSAQPRA